MIRPKGNLELTIQSEKRLFLFSFEASSHRSMPRPSIVSKHFDNSSGSEEDLTLGARRVMRQRKHEQENRKKLGSLVPINGPTSSTGNSQPVEVIRLWEAVLLRAKRAETDYFIGDLKIEATEASVGSYTSQKSSIACPVRQGKSYDVNFGHVEVREFLDSRISGESVISEETAIEETTQKL